MDFNKGYCDCAYNEAAGQKVSTVCQLESKTDSGNIHWNCTDFDGKKLASGIYFCELVQEEHKNLKKIILLQ